MGAVLTASNTRILIGDDLQDWSSSLFSFVPARSSLSESGIVTHTGILTLQENRLNPDSLDRRVNISRWRPGQSVIVQVLDSTDTFIQLGKFYILDFPNIPNELDPFIDLSLGCWLAWGNTLEQDGDRSGVELGVSTNSAVVASRLLQAADVPESIINLGTWPYNLKSPLIKEAGSGFIAQAGKLAWANDCRFIYQNSLGNIVTGQWTGTKTTPISNIELGLNDSLFEPNADLFQPVEFVKVVAQGFDTVETPQQYSDTFTVFVNASTFNENASGQAGITTTIINRWSNPTEEKPYFSESVEKQLIQPGGLVFKGSTTIQPTLIRETDESRYDPVNKRLIETRQSEEVDIRALVDTANIIASGRTLSRRNVTTFEYDDAKDTLIKRISTDTQPKVSITNVLEPTGNFVQFESAVTTTVWSEDRPDYWVERTEPKKVIGQSSEFAGGKLKPTALTTEKPIVRGDSRPPATQRWSTPVTDKEYHYEGLAEWKYIGGATGRNRTRTYTVEPGFSNEQCFNIAVAQVKLLEGRANAYLIECPLFDELIDVNPGSTIEVDDGSNIWSFAVDTLVTQLNYELSKIVFVGILLDRVAKPIPVNTPLPIFVSGLLDGQLPLPEPEPFELPQDLARNFFSDVTFSPLGFSSTIELMQAPVNVDMSATFGRVALNFGIETEPYGVVNSDVGFGELAFDAAVASEVNVISSSGFGKLVVNTNISNINVALLLHMDGTNGNTTFVDSSANNFTITANGTAQITTTNPKFGAGALLLDGDNSYLSWPSNAAFQMGSGDFTLEIWVNSNVAFSTERNLFQDPLNLETANGLFVDTAGKLNWWQDGIGPIISGTTTLVANAWYYVAVTRQSSVLSIYSGTSGSTTLEGEAFNSTDFDFSPWSVGGGFYRTDWSGRIDEARLTKGFARNVSTVPIGPF